MALAVKMKTGQGKALRLGLRKKICTGLMAGWILWGCAVAFAGSDTIHDFRLWSPVYLNFPITGLVMGYLEANPRFSDEASQIDQLILRPAIGYQLTSRLSLWQGYGWVANYEPEYSQEHRMFQQLAYLMAFPPVKLFSRSRLEERWIQNAVGTSLRARTLLRGDFPIPAHPSLAIVVYDEIFVNLNTIRQGPEAGFDQNRFFVGLNYIISPILSMDAGYQSQIVNTPLAGPANQTNHILLLQFFITL